MGQKHSAFGGAAQIENWYLPKIRSSRFNPSGWYANPVSQIAPKVRVAKHREIGLLPE